MMMAEGREERARISLLACWRFFHMSVTAILDLCWNAGSTWMWMSERRAKRWGSVEESPGCTSGVPWSQFGDRSAAVAAREPFRKVRLVGFSVIGITFSAGTLYPHASKDTPIFASSLMGLS